MEICEFVPLDAAQIHGEVSSNLYANLKAMGLEVWRVYSVLDELPAVDTAPCDMPLFDCKGQNAGGNGISFDWEILREVKFDFGMAGGNFTPLPPRLNKVWHVLKFPVSLTDRLTRPIRVQK